MIILDTNVVSEAMRVSPSSNVMDWLNRQPAETLFLTSVTMAELLFGVSSMPEGRRKHNLAETLEIMLLELYRGRVLPFDNDAARHYARLATEARAVGKGFPTPDGYIAAIASSKGFKVATRDTSPFTAAGLSVIDPWGTEA